MKALDYEWKVINPYHVRVRDKTKLSDKYVKMSLQLYQVDHKSYLLDFKSLSTEEMETGDEILDSAGTTGMQSQMSTISGHHTMEFFEMCAALIIKLAH